MYEYRRAVGALNERQRGQRKAADIDRRVLAECRRILPALAAADAGR